MTRNTPRIAALALAIAAALAAILTLAAPAAAQSDDETGRIVARRLDDGRVEFGWQPGGATRVLPVERYFPAPADATVDRWLNSSSVEVGGSEIGRIDARLLDDGRIEFAFTPTGGERVLTDARYFPTSARPNRWLRSTEITFSTAPGPFVAVSAGDNHTCGLRDTGTIECWGNNETGQIDVPDDRFAAVSTGQWHTCGLRESGAIKCWGANHLGQAQAPEGTFAAVSARARRTCGLRESGVIECWGNYGEQSSPPAGTFRAVSVGNAHDCGLRESGEIECWGANAFGQTDAPEGTFTAVGTGYSHTCGLRENGAIECWGINLSGQTDAPEGVFTAISVGISHACAIRDTGEIACWGYNKTEVTNHETGEREARETGQTDAPEGTFTAVSASYQHTCGLRPSGEIECWGKDRHGQTGRFR